ncbi:MAG: DNA mismatch repair endonuclease MutL [Dehalococcoidia bacterium]|nr:DNA mismatch repair endonuclease MutL [Dehalococcoidia bacterium]
MPIRVLSPTVAAKIAAGEVVEHPASVVKELVENSLDAGATHITVEVQGGGIDLIHVTDDGEGIPVLDLELALERHATSKISHESDLQSITSMGFRGEALPSIAAVSRMVLTSRVRGTDQGAYVRVRGSIMERKGAVGCPEGTSVTIQDLFANIPARRKFLRSAAAEAGRIHTIVTQLALAHPHVRFQLVVNGKESFASPGSGNIRDALAVVYAAETVDAMLEVSATDAEGRHAWGYVSPPSIHRANRSAINFYVNRRWIQSRLLLQAVEEAYKGLLMEGRHPVVAMHVDLDPAEVDVNVHPAKREVRFHNEGALFSLLQRAVRETLVAQSPVPLLAPSASSSTPLRWGPAPREENRQEQLPWRRLIPPGEQAHGQERSAGMPATLPALRVLGQASSTYIIAEGPGGVYLIDQHAAHERVRYEKVTQQARERQPEVQGLLEPQAVELQPAQIQTLEEWKETLASYGFQGEPFGESTYLLRGVPNGLKDARPEGLLGELLDLLSQARDPAQANDSVAASIACHSAVRAGDTLSHEEMVALVRQLEGAESPHTCPHGRPTMLHLSANSLEREFGRR